MVSNGLGWPGTAAGRAGFSRKQEQTMNEAFEPKILAFLCNWCSYAGADLAGVSRFQYPPTIRVMRTMCSGRIDPAYIVEGLKDGFDAVFVFGCHIGDCHYIDGNVYTSKRMDFTQKLLEISGIGANRMQLRWVSAAEGQQFADFVTVLSAEIREAGPFPREKYQLQLAALTGALNAPRLRWLVGMDRQLTERANVYNERIEEEKFRDLLHATAKAEYEKALILEVLRSGPQSVREIAAKTTLPVYAVSLILGDIERAGLAEFKGYEGSTPKFIRLAS